jgi:hypothetical protein
VTKLSKNSESLENNGEHTVLVYQVIDDSTKLFVSKMGYNFVSTHEVTKTESEDGLVKEVTRARGSRTGKDGFEFTDAKGNKSSTQSYDTLTERVLRIQDDTITEVSVKVDGKAEEVHDYVTRENIDGTSKTTRTTLRTPYTEKFGDWEQTTEKSDSNCYIKNVK